MSLDDTPTSSSIDLCSICRREPICENLGMIRYAVPMDDPRFGKMFRCPNNPVEQDNAWHNRLRRMGNLSAFANKTFDTFEVDSGMHHEEERQSLRHAHTAAYRFAQEPQGWLLFEGTYGCGKTHLAAAVGNFRLETGGPVLFITAPDLLDHLRAAFSPTAEATYDETFEHVRNVPLLIIDDLGVENPSQWAQEKLFQLLNHRYSHEQPTVITTNTDIHSLDPRVRSRLLDDQLITRLTIRAPDYRNVMQDVGLQLQSNLSLYQNLTFDTFDVQTKTSSEERKNLERVWQKAYQYAENPVGWRLFIGTYGCGKTHLAAAIGNFRRNVGDEIMFLTVPDLLDYLRTAFAPNSTKSFDQRFHEVKTVPLLILDDLETEYASSWAREKLFQLIDYRYVTQNSTVITTSKQLEELDERIRSRLLDDRLCTVLALTVKDSYAERRRRR